MRQAGRPTEASNVNVVPVPSSGRDETPPSASLWFSVVKPTWPTLSAQERPASSAAFAAKKISGEHLRRTPARHDPFAVASCHDLTPVSSG
jgi:hypothetical protein